MDLLGMLKRVNQTNKERQPLRLLSMLFDAGEKNEFSLSRDSIPFLSVRTGHRSVDSRTTLRKANSRQQPGRRRESRTSIHLPFSHSRNFLSFGGMSSWNEVPTPPQEKICRDTAWIGGGNVMERVFNEFGGQRWSLSRSW